MDGCWSAGRKANGRNKSLDLILVTSFRVCLSRIHCDSYSDWSNGLAYCVYLCRVSQSMD